jgi:hypothetical protein
MRSSKNVRSAPAKLALVVLVASAGFPEHRHDRDGGFGSPGRLERRRLPQQPQDGRLPLPSRRRLPYNTRSALNELAWVFFPELCRCQGSRCGPGPARGPWLLVEA